MDNQSYIPVIDQHVEDSLFWLEDNFSGFFNFISLIFTSVDGGVLWVLTLAPFYVVALIFGVITWRIVNLRTGVLLGAALVLCALMGLWLDTMSTLALVISAAFFALLISIPCGLVAGYVKTFDKIVMPILDFIQTFPPYIYLLPGIALLGYGSATALFATLIFSIPPALRLTSLGIRRTPQELIELGHVTGMTGWQMFYKIRLPIALPSIMAGVNQSIMLAFGMVVIAGIVGSGGLGETIYKAIIQLDIAKSVDATIAIVVLTFLLDRVSQGLVPSSRRE